MSPDTRAALRGLLHLAFWSLLMLMPCAALSVTVIAIAIYSQ
jgi:hypothetical protein